MLTVLKGIDCTIAAGELVAIMGSSGSGKSTLLNVLGLLDDFDEGSYVLNGQNMDGLSEKAAARYRSDFLGFVFQSFNLISYKTAHRKRSTSIVLPRRPSERKACESAGLLA